jgi:hypothetical protein
MLIVFFLSIYMVVDRDQIVSFLFRLVPPAYAEEALLLQTSVSRSFGGFLRGQALMGLVYFLIALATNLLLGLPLAPLTSVSAGVLQAIPFFGPFLSWAPPVIVALLFKPDVLLPTVILMVVGWFLVMNVLQPRIMQGSVGIHPIVVLMSVLIGSRIAGIPGAIFGIPVAAVLSAFFFHFLRRSSGDRTVAGRAARRLSAREGRTVRVPREPAPGQADVETREREDLDAGVARGAADGGHDSRARPDRAARPRQGARRAPGPERDPWEPTIVADHRAAARRMEQPAADPGDQRRRRRIARAARAQAGARSDGRHHGRRPGHQSERGRPPEDADAAPPRP